MAALTGLYYPYIQFKDDNWLKLAALYWDKLARIVPSDYRTQDSDTVKELADELGFVQNFAPDDRDTVQLGWMFREFIAQHGAKLRARYGVAESGRSLRRPSVVAYVSEVKMSYVLREVLEETGLALPQDNSDPRWVGMHPGLASVYMTALAEAMASKRGLQPVTDETNDHLAMSGVTLDRVAQLLLGDVDLAERKPTKWEIEERMAVVAIQSVIPRGLGNIPVKKIIALRKKHSAALAIFQDYVRDLVANQGPLREIQDAPALRLHLEVEYENKIKPQLDDLRQQLKALQIDTVPGAFNVKVVVPPLLATGCAALGIEVNPLLAAAGGLALGLIPIIREKQKQSREIMRSPVAYLLSVEEGLNPGTLTTRIATAARHFVLGV